MLKFKSPADRQLFGLCLGVSIIFSFIGMSTPLLPLLAVARGASPSTLGLLVALAAAGSLVMAIPSGMIIQRFGTRLPLTIACLVAGGSALGTFFFPTLPGLFLFHSIYKIAEIFIIVAAQTHIANLGKNRNAEQDYGWYGSAAAVGQFVGPPIGGFLMDHMGNSFTWLIMGLGLCLMCLTFRFLINQGVSFVKTKEEPWNWKKIKSLLNRQAFLAIAVSFAVIFTNGVRATFFPLFLKELHYTATFIGSMLAIRALASIGVRTFMGPFIKLVGGRFKALILSILIMGLGVFTVPLCTDPLSIIINAILIGFGIGLALPLSMAEVAESVAPEERGVAMGVRLTGNRFADALNPPFFGIISELAGMSLAFFSGGLLISLMLIPLVNLLRKQTKPAKN